MKALGFGGKEDEDADGLPDKWELAWFPGLATLGGGTAAHDWHTLTQGPAAIAHDIKDLGYVAESVHSH